MPKARWLFKEENRTVIFQCPGCNCEHAINVDPNRVHKNKDGATTKHPCWSFNGDMNSPTFSPSILVRSGKYASEEWYAKLDAEGKAFADRISKICHTFVNNGMIQFLGDCTHTLVNQTIALPEVEKFDELFIEEEMEIKKAPDQTVCPRKVATNRLSMLIKHRLQRGSRYHR